MNIQTVKQRFGIIGNSESLQRAITTALQVAPTDLSVLVTGESGVGKEVFSKIIHQFSTRKHAEYIAVNCGAIPEGTIDSELFGHLKGAFTGALSDRKGYFQHADGGTIFLDEIGELPLATQARLLRVLETGEFMKVGNSKVEKTDVRIVAATNVNLPEAVQKGKFREDLYYRLNTVPILIPPLRERREDIYLLFRKFATDFAEKYRMPPLKLTEDAQKLLTNYNWAGNIRQLKNVTEQISIIEKERSLNVDTLYKYLPQSESLLPALSSNSSVSQEDFANEREILYKVLFDMKKDMTDLKKLVYNLMESSEEAAKTKEEMMPLLHNLYKDDNEVQLVSNQSYSHSPQPMIQKQSYPEITDTEEIIEESLSLEENEKMLILKALEKNEGKRKDAAKDLGISERTLYRKIKEYELN